jgi:hypothetical protein
MMSLLQVTSQQALDLNTMNSVATLMTSLLQVTSQQALDLNTMLLGNLLWFVPIAYHIASHCHTTLKVCLVFENTSRPNHLSLLGRLGVD